MIDEGEKEPKAAGDSAEPMKNLCFSPLPLLQPDGMAVREQALHIQGTKLYLVYCKHSCALEVGVHPIKSIACRFRTEKYFFYIAHG